jgi:hypothetical protein
MDWANKDKGPVLRLEILKWAVVDGLDLAMNKPTQQTMFLNLDWVFTVSLCIEIRVPSRMW